VPKPQHNPCWNPELQEWFCSVCGRTSDDALESNARAELDQFDCLLVGIHKTKDSPEERKKIAITKKLQKKF
jgi:hypothetical protein